MSVIYYLFKDSDKDHDQNANNKCDTEKEKCARSFLFEYN